MPSSDTNSLCDAYRKLTEPQKQEFWTTLFRKETKWVSQLIANRSLLRGGYRVETVVSRRERMHQAGLDAAMTEDHVRNLRWASRVVLAELRAKWIDSIRRDLAQSPSENADRGVEAAVNRLAATAANDPWWEFFATRAKALPTGWLASGSAASPSAPVAGTPTVSPFSPDGGEKAAAELELIVKSARAARPFDRARAQELLEQLQVWGEQLRTLLEQEATAAGIPLPTWTTAPEIATIREQLRTTGRNRECLRQLAGALGSISTLRVNSKVKRERLQQACTEARRELELASLRETAPELPVTGLGRDWLRTFFELRDAEFDSAIASLRASALPAVAGFLEDTSWDQLEFDRTLAAPPAPVAIGTVASEPAREASAVQTDIAQSAADEAPAERQRETSTNEIGFSSTSETVKASEEASSLHLSTTDEPVGLAPRAPVEVVGALLRSGRPIVAAHYLDTYDETPSGTPPAAVLRTLAHVPFLRQSYGTVADAVRDALSGCEDTNLNEGPSVQLLAWSALLPASLIAPLAGAPVFLRMVRLPERLSHLHLLTEAAVTLVDQVPQCSPALLRGAQPRALWERTHAEIAEAAERFSREAPLQTILYQPAGEVWRFQVRQGSIGELTKLLRKKPHLEGVHAVRDRLSMLEGKAFYRLIQDTHRQLAPGSKERIEARAVPQIEGKLAPLLTLARRWLKAAEDAPPPADFISDRLTEFKRTAQSLLTSVETDLANWSPDTSDPLGRPANDAAHIAVRLVRSLVDPSSPWSEQDTDPSAAFALSLLCVPDLVMRNGKIDMAAERIRTAIETVAETAVAPRVALAARVARRDLSGAEALTATAEAMADDDATALRAEFRLKEDATRHEVLEASREVHHLLGTCRALGFFTEVDASALETRLAAAQNIAERELNLDDAHASLAQLRVEIESRRASKLDEVRQNIETKPLTTELKRRLLALVDKGDLTTINEYIGRYLDGQPLPELDALPVRSARFLPERIQKIAGALEASGGLLALASAVRKNQVFCETDFAQWSVEEREQTAQLIVLWDNFKRKSDLNDSRLASLLEGLGFIVTGIASAAGFAEGSRSEASTHPLADRAICPVPRFGSAARGKLTIFHTWAKGDEQHLIQLVGETAQESHLLIVFNYARLPAEKRVELAARCREKHRSFLVLDDLLFVHLCLEKPNRLGAFFSATIPYTYADPFVTSSSMVPPEMFYGRQTELAALMDSGNGSCFVYGGRQLGKTALLREAQRRFHDPGKERYATWIDLLNHGIGRESEPATVWQVLANEFGAWPSFQNIRATETPNTSTATLITKWLDADPRRRILVLLDEADKFLVEDAKRDYPIARQLKGLMEKGNNGRRFKVVFAGLHNVQRMTQQANHPLAHLGDPITVGSFALDREWMEAFKLAADPLTALGFAFTTPDLVSRILSLSNFYPALIQQFCSRLWRRSNERRISGPPYVISDREIEDIYRDPNLRENIVGRFILTLQLDPRYSLLAYTFAHYFLEQTKDAEKGLHPEELRRRAQSWHPRPLENLSDEEFCALLDEMCELGVFRRVGQRYTFRNPNVLLLLGSREQIEAKVLTEPRQPDDFTPQNFRARSRGNQHANIRRPLTLSDERRLSEPSNEVVVLIGSEALELGSFAGSLGDALPRANTHAIRNTIRDLPVFVRDLESQRESSRHTGDGLHIVRVAAMLPWERSWLDEASQLVKRLVSEKRFIRVIFEADPDRLWQSGASWLGAEGSWPNVRFLRLKKWPDEFLRPWLQDHNLPTAEEAPRMLRARTGGWPFLVHDFSRRLAQEGDWRAALAHFEPANTEGWARKFLGKSKEAAAGIELLRKIRETQPRPDDILRPEDWPEIAELAKIPLENIVHAIRVATCLGVADEVEGGTIWDPVVEKHLLSAT